MAKIADKYFAVDPWKVIERDFDPSYAQVAESIFSLGNEYMGVRGYFEEGFSGRSLIGSYFNGVYERVYFPPSGYKGIAGFNEFMVNSVNWLAAAISVDGERLDLNTAKIRDYERVLDMRSGLLTRSFIWETASGKQLELRFERFLPMSQMKIGVQRISAKPLNFDGDIEICMEADFGTVHNGKAFWEVAERTSEAQYIEIAAESTITHQYVRSACRFAYSGTCEETDYQPDKKIGKKLVFAGRKGETLSVLRFAENTHGQEAKGAIGSLEDLSFDALLTETTEWWKNTWDAADIKIEGDDENQQGIRFCIFQMLQTYHGAQPGNNIGAKGLTGEAYGGNAFWDTETYCLPFFIFNQMEAARNLLLFRYRTLPKAKERAAALDCKGAFYPISTISGYEGCNLWQHASLQLQASTAVAYGIWFYEKMSSDTEFLWDYGAEMLVEVCRMLATRGDWSADGKSYGYFCVMGPDEFQMMVNHNCYTNLMGKFTFSYTERVLCALEKADPERYQSLAEKLGIAAGERPDWMRKADAMVILQDRETGIFEQHDGFFRLPHVDVDKIPVEEFPLYHHWSYDHLYRNDMIKQPDVLMFMLLLNSSFTAEELKANYEYYEPKCIHESSLSPSVHSILAAQLGKKEEAYSFFRFATRMDLDNYNRNSNEGLHTTSIAAAWMNIVYGFGGMRSDGEILSFNPTIPDSWEGYSFRVTYHGAIIQVEVQKEAIRIGLHHGEAARVSVYGQIRDLTPEMQEIEIPTEWR